MTEKGNALREIIVETAKEWLGTPFHHEARLKGVGVDCGQFLIGVYSSLDLIPNVKVEHYPRDFARHSDDEWYLRLMRQYSKEVEAPTGPGDAVLFKWGRTYSHAAIILDWPNFIHAWTPMGRVCYGRADLNPLANKPRKFFTICEI